MGHESPVETKRKIGTSEIVRNILHKMVMLLPEPQGLKTRSRLSVYDPERAAVMLRLAPILVTKAWS